MPYASSLALSDQHILQLVKSTQTHAPEERSCSSGNKHLDENHPNRILTKTPHKAQRINKKSILTVADNLKDKYHHPDNKEPLFIVDKEHPQNTVIQSPMINT